MLVFFFQIWLERNGTNLSRGESIHQIIDGDDVMQLVVSYTTIYIRTVNCNDSSPGSSSGLVLTYVAVGIC